MERRPWILTALVWLDQGINALFYPLLNVYFRTQLFGNEDETISSVLGKLSAKRNERGIKWASRVDYVFYKLAGQVNHCANNIEKDEGV